jgi:GMP synthase (glutamine-hydrolysing)
MKPVLLVGNDEHETFGVAPSALSRAGCDLVTVNMTSSGAALPPLGSLAGVVTFGGTPNVDDIERHPYLSTVREYSREAVAAKVPYLGLCLGSQLLARALAEEVWPASMREFGFQPLRPTAEAGNDPLLSLFVDGDMVFQWHEDTYRLPEGATLLATGDAVPVQAYRVGELAWGVQFHQELDAVELEWWLEIADADNDLEDTWGKSASEIRSEARRHMPLHEERGRTLFARFAEVVLGRSG